MSTVLATGTGTRSRVPYVLAWIELCRVGRCITKVASCESYLCGGTVMLRRQPTEIVVKLEEIDEMITEMKKQTAGKDEEGEKTLSQAAVRSRIGAPSPRIRIVQATDTQLVGTSSDSPSLP